MKTHPTHLLISALVASQLDYTKAQPYTVTDCLQSFQALNFGGLGEFSRYGEYFTDKSFVQLAQTGKYVGPQDIEEYVRFTGADSPYIAEALPIKDDLQFKRLDPATGVCEFTYQSSKLYTTDPNFALDSTFTSAVLAKIYYNLADHKISQVNVFFTQDFFDFVFGQLLHNRRSFDFVCGVMIGNCPDTYELNGSPTLSECVAQMQALPVLSDQGRVDGREAGCRTLHSVFAEKNPMHCAHISFVPQADPMGHIKCQESFRLEVSDLFDEQDLAQFDAFVLSPESGIESLEGFRVITLE